MAPDAKITTLKDLASKQQKELEEIQKERLEKQGIISKIK